MVHGVTLLGGETAAEILQALDQAGVPRPAAPPAPGADGAPLAAPSPEVVRPSVAGAPAQP
eukprot:5824443-Alexandrium_andersonii.AAC.1